MGDEKPPAGDINLKDLEKMQDRLANLEGGLHKLRGGSVRVQSAKKEGAEEGEAEEQEEPRDGTGALLYSWPWERDKEISEKKMRQSLIYSDMSNIAVHAGQLLAADLDDEGHPDSRFTLGDDVLCGAGGRRIFAAVDGLVQWKGNRVSVSPIRKIDGDLTSKIGNVVTSGSVIVTGDVEDGMTIQAVGDIMVVGTVGKATLSSGGTITVKKGIRGGGQGTVRAGIDVCAGFIENATVEAENNIIADEAIMQSRVTAGRKIVCIGDKGLIVGGTLQAGEEVNCRDLGTNVGVETIITVGARGADKAALEQVRQELQRTKEKVDGLRKQVNEIATRKTAGQLAEGEQETLNRLIEELKQTESVLERLQTQEQRLVEALESPIEGMVNVAGTAYPGRKIAIGRSDPTVMHKEEKRVCYIEKKGTIGLTNYHDPKIKRPAPPAAAAAAEAVEINLAEHAARLVRLRKCQRLLADNEAVAQRQAAHFLALPAEALVAFAVPDPAGAKKERPAAGDKGAAGKKGAAAGGKKPGGKKEDEKPAAPELRTFLVVQIVAGEVPAALQRKYLPGVKRTSIEVTCDSLADGLKQGVKELGVPVDQLQHKVIQERSKGVFGIGQKPYILRISIKPKKEVCSVSAEAMAQIGQTEDGRFLVANEDRGLLLTVYPPKGDGLRVEVDQVKKVLAEHQYRTAIDTRAIADAVRAATGEPVIIAARQVEPELDGGIEVVVSPDKMQCTVKVTPAKPQGRATTVEDLVRKLTETGVKRFDQELLRKIYAEGLYGKPLVVAQGLPATPGQDGRWELKTGPTGQKKKTAHLDADEHGKVDFREMHMVENVTAGQVIAAVFPPVPGQPGLDVFDREIPVKPVKENSYTLGRNTELSADGKQVLATADGQVILIGRTLRVEPVYYVGGDVDFNTGNISFLGAVVVKGTVCQGFTVRAAGNITAGSVDKATLDAEGDVIVQGGIIGDEAVSTISAGRDIHAKFVNTARLRAGRDIIVAETVMHSECSAGRAVVCQAGKKGVIVGGVIRAGRVVAAKEIGTEVATKTVVEVGLDPVVRQQITELEKTLEEYAKNSQKIVLGMKVLLELKRKGALPPAKEELLQQLQAAAVAMQQKISKTEEQQATLQASLVERGEGKINAALVLHPGCRLTIRNATLILEMPVQHTTFGYDAGEVRAMTYTEYIPKEESEEE